MAKWPGRTAKPTWRTSLPKRNYAFLLRRPKSRHSMTSVPEFAVWLIPTNICCGCRAASFVETDIPTTCRQFWDRHAHGTRTIDSPQQKQHTSPPCSRVHICRSVKADRCNSSVGMRPLSARLNKFRYRRSLLSSHPCAFCLSQTPP